MADVNYIHFFRSETTLFLICFLIFTSAVCVCVFAQRTFGHIAKLSKSKFTCRSDEFFVRALLHRIQHFHAKTVCTIARRVCNRRNSLNSEREPHLCTAWGLKRTLQKTNSGKLLFLFYNQIPSISIVVLIPKVH